VNGIGGLERLLPEYGLLAVFVGAFFEGEGVLLAASVLAARGVLSPIGVWLAASLGAWSGHLVWFFLGRRFARRLLPRFESLAERTAEVDRIVEAHPRTAVFVLQYLYGVRMLGALALGLMRFSWRRFVLYEAVNCLVWAALFTGAGYAVGAAAERFLHGWVRWIWVAASVVVLLGVVHHVSQRSLRGRREGEGR
jgi:membrane-associated protein